MPTAIVTGSGGLIGSESVQHFVEAASTSSASRTTCARGSSARRRRRRTRPSGSRRSLRRRVSLARDRHSRRRRPSTASSPSTARLARARDPHRGAAVARLGGVGSADGLRGQRQRHAQPARGDAPTRADATFIFCSTNKVYGDLPNQLPLIETDDPTRAARGPSLLSRASTRRCRSMRRRTRCSASPRPRPICSSRSTAATSTCRPSASAAAASPDPTTPGRDCTASSPT